MRVKLEGHRVLTVTQHSERLLFTRKACVTVAYMTAMRKHKPTDPLDVAIADEIRGTIAIRRLDQATIASEVFQQPQQWLSRRLNGHVEFTGAEIKRLGDYLKQDINEWFAAAKRRAAEWDNDGQGMVSHQKLGRKLSLLKGYGLSTPERCLLGVVR